MKQFSKYLAGASVAVVLGAGLFAFAGMTPAYAGSSGCDTGCQPPPPPPADDCGCDGGGHDDGGGDGDSHGHGGGSGSNSNANTNINKNTNINDNTNTNNNTNNNTNTNNNNVEVNNEINIDVTVDASSSSNSDSSSNSSSSSSAQAAADAAAQSQVSNATSTSSRRNALFGDEVRGAGGTVYQAPRPQISMGPIVVVERQSKRGLRPVKGVCLDAKGGEDTAFLSVDDKRVDISKGRGELMYCRSGETLVATVGVMTQDDGAAPDYTGGYVIECQDGETLNYGDEGRLACVAGGRHAAGASRAHGLAGGRYAELFLTKESIEESASAVTYAGATTFSGGVGY